MYSLLEWNLEELEVSAFWLKNGVQTVLEFSLFLSAIASPSDTDVSIARGISTQFVQNPSVTARVHSKSSF